MFLDVTTKNTPSRLPALGMPPLDFLASPGFAASDIGVEIQPRSEWQYHLVYCDVNAVDCRDYERKLQHMENESRAALALNVISTPIICSEQALVRAQQF